jgi:CheY-like chemotaxis protein
MAEGEKRALVVEDAPDLSSLLATVIRLSGWVVEVVANGAEALQTFKPGSYDLVITDINLGGGLDGIALAQRLLALEPGLRITVMSGSASADADRAKAAGLGSILAKPFEPKQVLEIIRRI